jgi:nucleoside-diphosphate-sugar epimerase
MTIFVTGATGVMGRSVVHLLAPERHVRAVARTPEKAAWLGERGAEPVTVDLFDATAVKDAVAGSDTVLHLATNIPELRDMRRASAWETNDRLRTLSTRFLVDAALAHGVSTFVAESITFCYPDRGSDWIDETAPWGDDALMRSVVDLESEVTRFAEHGGSGVSLRFGSFYGPDARSTHEMLRVARRGLAPFLGSPDAYMSSIHTDDTATAVVAALGVPTGVYNVCDQPMTRRDVADAMSAAFGLKRLRFAPRFAQRIMLRKAGEALLRSQRVSSEKFRAASGWAPKFPDARAGLADVARVLEARR